MHNMERKPSHVVIDLHLATYMVATYIVPPTPQGRNHLEGASMPLDTGTSRIQGWGAGGVGLVFQSPTCSDDLAALVSRAAEFNAGELFAMVGDSKHEVSDVSEKNEVSTYRPERIIVHQLAPAGQTTTDAIVVLCGWIENRVSSGAPRRKLSIS